MFLDEEYKGLSAVDSYEIEVKSDESLSFNGTDIILEKID